MNTIIIAIISVIINLLPINNSANLNDFAVKDINMNKVNLSDYNGKVLLIVNVASKCGYTRQYTGLQEIYEKYNEKGFEVLGFPSNDFGGQEPGTNKEIKEFCSTQFNVTFPMFDKVKVLGSDKSPLFEYLTNNSVTGQNDIRWNFEKFLINKNGEIVQRFGSSTEPTSEELNLIIEKELEK